MQCLGGFNYRRPPLDRKRSERERERERESGWLFESFRDKGIGRTAIL